MYLLQIRISVVDHGCQLWIQKSKKLSHYKCIEFNIGNSLEQMVKTRSGNLPRKNKKSKKKKQIVKLKKHICKQQQIEDEFSEKESNPLINNDNYEMMEVPLNQSSDPQDYIIQLKSKNQQSDYDQFQKIELVQHKSEPDQQMNANQLELLANNKLDIQSHASTENKVDFIQMRQRMGDFDTQLMQEIQANKMNPTEFHNQSRYNLDVSTCDTIYVEIQENIRNVSKLNDVKFKQQLFLVQHGNNFQLKMHNQSNYVSLLPQQQIQQKIQIIPHQEKLQQNEELIHFGPPNIDDLSTNQSLHNRQQQFQLQMNHQQPHIFIENEQNIFENLSDISTKPCMSNVDHMEMTDREHLHELLTDDEYNEMLWKLKHNEDEAFSEINIEQAHQNLKKYLGLILKCITNEQEMIPTRFETKQFWTIMHIIKLKLRDYSCIKMMINLVNIYNQCNYEHKNRFIMEYELIKGRVQSLSMVCMKSQERECIMINQIMNRDFFKRYA